MTVWSKGWLGHHDLPGEARPGRAALDGHRRLLAGPGPVADAVSEGTIPAAEADDVFICVGVFIHWEAADDKKIQEYNYKATKESIERAVKGTPKAYEVQQKYKTAKHPFAAAS